MINIIYHVVIGVVSNHPCTIGVEEIPDREALHCRYACTASTVTINKFSRLCLNSYTCSSPFRIIN